MAPLQARRARPEQIFRSPQPQRGVIDDQKQREGGEQLEQFGRGIDPPQQEYFDERADDADDDRARDDPAPEAERTADRRHQRDGDISPQHVKRAMRDVDDARDAEDQGKPGRDEEQTGCRSQAVERLKR